VRTFRDVEIEFEWDPRKDRANQAKHGVSFSEAATAFYDENGYLLDDPDHSDEEDHFVLLGLSSALRLLVVVHCSGARMRRSASFRPERPTHPRLLFTTAS
jgi:hypothetical protein